MVSIATAAFVIAYSDTFVASVAAPSHPTVVEPDVAFMLDAESIRFILSGPPDVIIS